MKMAQEMSMHVALPVKSINPLRELKKFTHRYCKLKPFFAMLTKQYSPLKIIHLLK